MKTAIFTWLFLLPLQIYAANYNSRLSETMVPKASQSEVNVGELDQMNLDLLNTTAQQEANSNFQAIAVSQENDIQKLKSQLAHKNHEIYTQELDQWKFQSAALLFFVGMMLFAFLYIKGKLTNSQPEVITISKLYSKEK